MQSALDKRQRAQADRVRRPRMPLAIVPWLAAVMLACAATPSLVGGQGFQSQPQLPVDQRQPADDLRPAAEPAAPPRPAAEGIPTGDLWRMMRDGGPLMLALAGCSLVLGTFILERAINLRRGRVIPRPFVSRFLEQLGDGELDRQQALSLCEENGSPIAGVFAAAVRKWGRPAVEVEQAALDAGERAANHLRRYLRVFYGIANVGPLLGLMGTVLGMIQTFNSIASHDALGRAEMLAGGIAKALLNTAGGLAVAIPASIVYVFFLSRVDRLVMDIDEHSQEVVHAISAEDLAERQSRPVKVKAKPQPQPQPQRQAA